MLTLQNIRATIMTRTVWDPNSTADCPAAIALGRDLEDHYDSQVPPPWGQFTETYCACCGPGHIHRFTLLNAIDRIVDGEDPRVVAREVANAS